MPDNSSMTPACDRASLGSKPRQPTNQSISPVTEFSAIEPKVFGKFSQGVQPDFKTLARAPSPVRVYVSVIELSDEMKRRND